MKYILPSLIFFLISNSSFAQDSCEQAHYIDEGLHTVELIDGFGAPQPVCATGGNTADSGEWYRYTATDDGVLIVSTDLPQNTGVDTRVNIYTGDCDNLLCVAGDDDSGSGYLSLASLNTEVGETYIIAFDNNWESTGFDFTVSLSEPSDNPVSFVAQGISTSGSSMCVVDMNSDRRDDVVSVSATNININYQQADGSFEEVDYPTSEADYTASWSISAGDIDGNGYMDLMYGGGSGVTFMMANQTSIGFTEVSGPEYVFCQRTNMVDINNDGHLDAFSCHDVQPNVYYLNDGDGNLTFYQGGIGDTPDGGNYGSIWVDYDNDHDIDMFIAKCRGGDSPANINQLHNNNGDGTYTEVAESYNLADNVQTWSSAWGDFDNDGDMDAFIGASSTVNGGHKLMRNGLGSFSDVTAGSGFDTYESTGIEWCTHDFNNDGYLDVFGAGGNILMNNGDMTFTPVPVSVPNGAVGDLNGDGFLDILGGSAIFRNSGNDNNYLRVYTLGTESNLNGIGARVEVTSALGTQIRDVRAGDGFRYMSTITTHFGIADDTEIESVTVYWPSGNVDMISSPDINTTLVISEGSSPLGVDELSEKNFSIFPNPTTDQLNIRSSVDVINTQYEIIDISGKVVQSSWIGYGPIDVSKLNSGLFILRLIDGDGTLERPFAKE